MLQVLVNNMTCIKKAHMCAKIHCSIIINSVYKLSVYSVLILETFCFSCDVHVMNDYMHAVLTCACMCMQPGFDASPIL